MPNLASLSTGTKIVLAAGLLLLIDTFFAWQEVSVDIGGTEVAAASANAWHGLFGWLMGLLLIALLVWVGLQVANVDLPSLPIAAGMLTLALGAAVFICAVLKNLIDDESAWASYVGVVLAAAVAYGAWLRSKETDALPARTTSEPTTTPPAAEL